MLKICMLLEYIIDYAPNFLHTFLKLVNIIFYFLNNEITTSQEPKALSDNLPFIFMVCDSASELICPLEDQKRMGGT
jgi:hypothetical protein